MTDRTPIRWIILLLSAAVGLSALAGLIGACIPLPANAAGERPVLVFPIGLEASVVACAAFGVLVGLGRFKDGRAITLLCIGGGVATASVMGVLSAGQAVFEAYQINLNPLRNARVAAGMVFVALAALEVLARRPAVSLPLLARGLIWGAPLAAAGALWMNGFLPARLAAMGQMPQIIIAVVSFVVFCVLISASAHYLIRAFAVGVEVGEQNG